MSATLMKLASASAGQAPVGTVASLPPQGRNVPRQSLDELLGTVAHELRNPLASVLTGVYLLTSEYRLDPPVREAMVGMEQQLQRAMRLVDDLYDVCAGGLSKLSLCKEVVCLAELVARAAESADRLLAARRHRLTITLPPGRPMLLDADPVRLEQVLVNLLSNAAKFTDSGGHIRLSAASEDGHVVLRVRDNGRGIAPDLLPRVFDRFYQLPKPTAQRTGGLGIGLTLVKSLVELHGGTVAAHSDGPGTGAEFVVRLPISAMGSEQRNLTERDDGE